VLDVSLAERKADEPVQNMPGRAMYRVRPRPPGFRSDDLPDEVPEEAMGACPLRSQTIVKTRTFEKLCVNPDCPKHWDPKKLPPWWLPVPKSKPKPEKKTFDEAIKRNRSINSMTYDLAKELKDAGFPQEQKAHPYQWGKRMCIHGNPHRPRTCRERRLRIYNHSHPLRAY
jgi:hypothetical protein